MKIMEQTLAYVGQNLRENIYNNNVRKYELINNALSIIERNWKSNIDEIDILKRALMTRAIIEANDGWLCDDEPKCKECINNKLQCEEKVAQCYYDLWISEIEEADNE